MLLNFSDDFRLKQEPIKLIIKGVGDTYAPDQWQTTLKKPAFKNCIFLTQFASCIVNFEE